VRLHEFPERSQVTPSGRDDQLVVAENQCQYFQIAVSERPGWVMLTLPRAV
jgi:hypothetical protein